IFDGRSSVNSETWIFGGALDCNVTGLNELEILKLIANERERLRKHADEPLSSHVTFWREALPHYSIELESSLRGFPSLPSNLALVGNYLGGIGLSQIIDRAASVAAQFATS